MNLIMGTEYEVFYAEVHTLNLLHQTQFSLCKMLSPITALTTVIEGPWLLPVSWIGLLVILPSPFSLSPRGAPTLPLCHRDLSKALLIPPAVAAKAVTPMTPSAPPLLGYSVARILPFPPTQPRKLIPRWPQSCR